MSGARTIAAAHSLRRTPHLTSPLKGGRDEFWKVGGGESGVEVAQVPACAGMTEGGRNDGGGRRGVGTVLGGITALAVEMANQPTSQRIAPRSMSALVEPGTTAPPTTP